MKVFVNDASRELTMDELREAAYEYRRIVVEEDISLFADSRYLEDGVLTPEEEERLLAEPGLIDDLISEVEENEDYAEKYNAILEEILSDAARKKYFYWEGAGSPGYTGFVGRDPETGRYRVVGISDLKDGTAIVSYRYGIEPDAWDGSVLDDIVSKAYGSGKALKEAFPDTWQRKAAAESGCRRCFAREEEYVSGRMPLSMCVTFAGELIGKNFPFLIRQLFECQKEDVA